MALLMIWMTARDEMVAPVIISTSLGVLPPPRLTPASGDDQCPAFTS